MTSAGDDRPSRGAAAPTSAAKSATGNDLPRTSSAGRPSSVSVSGYQHDLFDHPQRYAVHGAPALEQQHLEEREREREHQDDIHPLAGLAADLKAAPQ